MRFLTRHTLTAAILFCVWPAAAHATPCVNPPGDEGDQVYNITYHVMQYCNGSHWVAMGSVMGQGDNLGDHTAGQALDMDGFRIENLAPPTADNHAVTRAYVTSTIAAIPAPTTPDLSAVLAAGNAAGNRKITGLATPTASTDAATMAYADTKVRKAGDTMTGALNIPVTPTANAHATSKEYVDTVVASAAGGGGGTIYMFKSLSSTPPSCPSGWTSLEVGAVAIPYTSSSANTVGGDTLCLSGEATRNNYGYALVQYSSDGFVRCRVCIKD